MGELELRFCAGSYGGGFKLERGDRQAKRGKAEMGRLPIFIGFTIG